MTQDVVMDLMRDGLYTIMVVALPPLLMGLVVGLTMSLFQTITSIQEQTLAFIPKILAVLVALLLFGPFMLDSLQAYMMKLVMNMPDYIVPR
jgi:flagellar biosynthetic protein FliQ